MFDCIFTPHCTRTNCDFACPIHAEITYWMERCNIEIDNPVLLSTDTELKEAQKIIDSSLGCIRAIEASDTTKMGDLLSYVAICLHGIGTAFSNGIYKLNFSNYIESIKRSWQTREEPSNLEYARIWSESARYTIINGLDYVKFGDFESQTLLQILQSRKSAQKATILVIPGIDQLVGQHTSVFFTRLLSVLEEVSD